MRYHVGLAIGLVLLTAVLGRSDDPRSAEDFYQRGLARSGKNDLDGAIADYTRGVELDPRLAKAWHDRGVAYGRKGDLRAAIADFGKAIDINPRLSDAFYNRGYAQSVLGNLDAAIADYDKAITINPRYAVAYNSRGLARADKRNLAGAIADYDKAIEINPRYVGAYVNRGLARVDKGDPAGAIADYDKAIEINPRMPVIWSNRGNARKAKGDVDGAIADYTKAIEVDPRYAPAYYNRGMAREDKADPNGAIADYTKAIEINPKMGAAYNNRGQVRANRDDLEGALADFNKSIALNPRDSTGYLNRGVARKQKGDRDAALADFNKALELNPREARAFAHRGAARLLKGDEAKAQKDFDACLKLDANLKPLVERLGKEARAQRDKKPADEQLWGKYRYSFRHDDIITCAAFSKDGRRLAAGSEVGTVMVSDLQAQKEVVLKNPDARDNGVQTLRFSQDGKLLLVGGFGVKKGGREIAILRTSDWTMAKTLDVPGGAVVDYLDMSPDNKWLISADGGGAKVWEWQNKRLAWRLSLKGSAPLFDGDRTLLLGVGKVERAAKLEMAPGGEGKPVSTAVAAGQIVFFDILDGKVSGVVRTLPEEPIRRLVLARGKKELFALTEPGTVYRLDSKTGEVKQRIALADLYRKVSKQRLEAGPNTEFEVLEDQPILVYNDRTHTFFANYETGKVLAVDHQSTVGLRFSPTGKEFALLGGVKREALTGIADQHFWTVNVFSFKPF